MKKDQYVAQGRAWLNPKQHADTGAVSWRAQSSAGYLDAELTIRDCSRQITLDFGCGNKAEARQRLKKIALLEQALGELREAIGGGDDVTEDWVRAVPNECVYRGSEGGDYIQWWTKPGVGVYAASSMGGGVTLCACAEGLEDFVAGVEAVHKMNKEVIKWPVLKSRTTGGSGAKLGSSLSSLLPSGKPRVGGDPRMKPSDLRKLDEINTHAQLVEPQSWDGKK